LHEETTDPQHNAHYGIGTLYGQARIGPFVGNNPARHADPLGLAKTGQRWTGFGAATWTVNGRTYPGSTKTDFIVALMQATENGQLITSVIYNGHTDPVGGALLMYGHKQDANDPNTTFFPDDLRRCLEHFSDLFDFGATFEFGSCGSVNPNIYGPADAVIDALPDADVWGWTGLTCAGKWGLGRDTVLETDYAKNPLVPQRSQFVHVK
jgi:hypothetical protein